MNIEEPDDFVQEPEEFVEFTKSRKKRKNNNNNYVAKEHSIAEKQLKILNAIEEPHP